jgi:hypothetical protein
MRHVSTLAPPHGLWPSPPKGHERARGERMIRCPIAMVSVLLLSGCNPAPTTAPQDLDQAMKALDSPIGAKPQGHSTRVTATANASSIRSIEVTPTSISVGVTMATPQATPPYTLDPTIRFDGEYLQINAKTDLPDGTLYRLGVQRHIAVTASPTSTVTSMATHAGGFLPHDKVDLPEEGLPLSTESFIPQAGRIAGGEFVALVQMFPRHVQLMGSESDADRYTPNTKEVDVTFAVERDLPGQLKGLTWPQGTERFVWRHTVPCPLPDKAQAP